MKCKGGNLILSKTKRNGGYVFFDCTGVNIASSQEQTVPGIFEKANNAIKTKKPILAINAAIMKDGVTLDEFSPIPVFGCNDTSAPDNAIQLYAGSMVITIVRGLEDDFETVNPAKDKLYINKT